MPQSQGLRPAGLADVSSAEQPCIKTLIFVLEVAMKDIQKARKEKESARIMAEVAARFERTWGAALQSCQVPSIPALMRVPRLAQRLDLKRASHVHAETKRASAGASSQG